MPTTATTDQPTVTALTDREREVLRVVGRGLTDAEIAAALAMSVDAVAGHLERILAKLGLRDRCAAIVHAFDSGLVVPGQDSRRYPASPVPQPVRISVLGPLRVWHDGQLVDVGPARQQAVLAALALCPDRAVSRQELLDGVWGLEPPNANVVPVYIYRLRKILHRDGNPDSVIKRDRCGYRLARGAVQVDVTRMEELVTAAEAAARAGEVDEAVRACSQALDLFAGEPLAGLPGPFAELERLRFTERRITLAQRKLDWQLSLGQHREAVAELSALAAEQPLNEPVAVMLMRALARGGRRAEALAVFDRIRRHLAENLGVPPGETLRRTRLAVLRDDRVGIGAAPGRTTVKTATGSC
ncbi:BTAD domain-containing putative transcriptional regulator [Amycolatopsis cynarae]|uniref:BTAD domain-containing putative transcriptional regulator n=1 Tax=Amycolatopsis cynarae TaxID=2995223 RepID=A0ABY7B3C5_9PSEU|nr:BTAD domain-containing putative transcriptional regulator [Amycolatopsis sp. HUAS 11-8]WAL66455.1 BTAD domain-containing putative transcriptional regulator [Amycolatopsis sp. HUAS 11-8]